MKNLHLSIISPEKTVFEGEVKIVRVPGAKGAFAILPSHAPIVSLLAPGTVSYVLEADGQACTLDIQGGFVEVNHNRVSVCISG